MRNRQTAMWMLTNNRLLQHATIPLTIMGLLLACSPMPRGATGEAPRQVAGNAGPMAEGVDSSNQPLPKCNVRDNRDAKYPEANDCTEMDNQQNTIAIKVATREDPERGIEKGQTFLCQCGNAQLVTVEGTVAGDLDEVESLAITSQNPTCLVWSRVGGKKECVLQVP